MVGMLEQARRLVTEIPDYPITPGDINTSDVNSFQKGLGNLDAGIVANLFFSSLKTEEAWRPLTQDQIQAPLIGSTRLQPGIMRRGLEALVQQGYLVQTPEGYHPSADFVTKALEITAPPA